MMGVASLRWYKDEGGLLFWFLAMLGYVIGWNLLFFNTASLSDLGRLLPAQRYTVYYTIMNYTGIGHQVFFWITVGICGLSTLLSISFLFWNPHDKS